MACYSSGCQQIIVRHHQVPALLISVKNDNFPLIEVNPPAQMAEGHAV